EAAVNEGLPAPYRVTAMEHGYEINAIDSGLPPLRMKLAGEAAFTIASHQIDQVLYRSEQSRGYAYEGALWSPGFFQVDMHGGNLVGLIASTESWDIINVLELGAGVKAEEERRAR